MFTYLTPWKIQYLDINMMVYHWWPLLLTAVPSGQIHSYSFDHLPGRRESVMTKNSSSEISQTGFKPYVYLLATSPWASYLNLCQFHLQTWVIRILYTSQALVRIKYFVYEQCLGDNLAHQKPSVNADSPFSPMSYLLSLNCLHSLDFGFFSFPLDSYTFFSFKLNCIEITEDKKQLLFFSLNQWNTKL